MTSEIVDGEWQDWYELSPEERFLESQKLWEVFLLMGGRLDPEPDSQSPFHDFYIPPEGALDGGTGLHPVRRSGIQSGH
tara:strand:- start:68 stop:304 length:237 start_codon:yes stop_codon:yes gene_type:complete